MKQLAAIFITTCFIPLTLLAQRDACELSNTDAFFVHQVQQGETLFSISQQYDIDLKRIKKLNRIHPDSNTIAIADVLVVPVNPLPANQDKNDQQASEATHEVKEGQTLFSIARRYKNVSVDSIKKWNELQSDTLDVGQELRLRSSEKAPSVPGVDKKSNANGTLANQAEDTSQERSKEENFIFQGNQEDKQTEKADTTAQLPPDSSSQALPFEEFRNIYQEYEQKGMAKQTERGVATWLDENYARGDANYYSLHKYAPVGSVVKVRNLMNDRQVYVKVIGRLSNTESNRNVLVKITEASADYLNVLDEKFLVEVTTYSEGGITNQ